MEKQNGIIIGYVVHVMGPEFSQEIFVQDAKTTSVEIPGLRPFTSYTFTISAMTNVGTGPVATITPEEGENV